MLIDSFILSRKLANDKKAFCANLIQEALPWVSLIEKVQNELRSRIKQNNLMPKEDFKDFLKQSLISIVSEENLDDYKFNSLLNYANQLLGCVGFPRDNYLFLIFCRMEDGVIFIEDCESGQITEIAGMLNYYDLSAQKQALVARLKKNEANYKSSQRELCEEGYGTDEIDVIIYFIDMLLAKLYASTNSASDIHSLMREALIEVSKKEGFEYSSISSIYHFAQEYANKLVSFFDLGEHFEMFFHQIDINGQEILVEEINNRCVPVKE